MWPFRDLELLKKISTAGELLRQWFDKADTSSTFPSPRKTRF